MEVQTFLYIRDPPKLKAAIQEANEYVSVRRKPEPKSASVNAVERHSLSPGETRIAALERKVDSLVKAMTEMLR